MTSIAKDAAAAAAKDAAIAALRERKRAFARSRGADVEACENDACGYDLCECGASCECELELARDRAVERVTCEPCVEAKARRLASASAREG